ncbi:hypothetical protein LTS08_001870 [Lithohypha guttulata]|uniref:uncharacterized protein n=1 Tax=Lithohypha guttulata TaxID=1690604 RepID=UPI002DE0CEAB|nr:hypothetical protein LTR51_003446 [Lithohypha guttulata]KAK5105593.1 hypothetical protein LTS08_001870 [Lithohypha guttulata]
MTSWNGRSHVSVFVHSLHLLNLNAREDWPEVTLHTFDVKSSLQHRIRCVEWSLYCLFELFDARATRDKLRPFFPPATSLQSVNLRAALLRQLTELKKDGVLGPNVILRKTMLDECKGDKVEELLAAFSIVVLKKVLNVEGVAQPENLLPLVLARRAGIQRNLDEKKELDWTTKQEQHNIEHSIEVLSKETRALQSKKVPQLPNHATHIKGVLRENWIGDPAWVDTILHGVPSRTLNHIVTYKGDVDDNASSLLEDLQSRLQNQNVRLAKWQSYFEDLHHRDTHKHTASVPNTNQRSVRPPLFTRHKDLEHVSDNVSSTAAEMLVPKHAILLESLEKELSLRTASLHHKAQSSGSLTKADNNKSNVNMIYLGGSKNDNLSNPRTQTTTSSLSFRNDDSLGHGIEPGRHRLTPFQSISLEKPVVNAGLPEPFTQQILKPHPETPPEPSLMERTRASMARFETPNQPVLKNHRPSTSTEQPSTEQPSIVIASQPRLPLDRLSLAERTRQSMSMLNDALDDSYRSRPSTSAKRPTHTRSRTAIKITSHKPRLERAWSEESLASTATKDDNFDVEADYDSVFKSRPRLAMSPNLSPQRNEPDPWLENLLEQGMNKLSIDSSPDA